MTRIHVVSLPHTLLTRQYDWCAYTAKVRRFTTMLAMAGVHSIVYGPDQHDTPGAGDYVPIIFEADRQEWFGRSEWDPTRVFDRWDATDPCWRISNQRAARQIRERWLPGDILGIIGGLCQQQIITDLADLNPLVTEWGIGYSGIIPGTHRVYESYAWAHHIAGYYREDDIRHFDAVIPNCFDSADFSASTRPGDYLLFMGRPNLRKGLPIIEEIAKHVDCPILIAGQPGPPIPGTKHVGLVTGQEKADLLAGAYALLAPTTYLEPFGGVAVEAMMSGTPVIATDWGAFTETVINGVTGYRCRTLADFLHALNNSKGLDRDAIRRHSVAHYSLERGSALYSDYLNSLSTLHGEGWYDLPQGVRFSCSLNPQ